MRFRKQPHGGFVSLVPLLVILMFALAILLTLNQRQRAQGRHLKRILETRLNQELAREMHRLGALPAQQRAGAQGEELAARAIENLLARALDHLMSLEQRRARLRQLARHSTNANQRLAARRRLPALHKAIHLERFWILLVKARQRELRRDGPGPPGAPPGFQPPDDHRSASPPDPREDRLPAIPDWW